MDGGGALLQSGLAVNLAVEGVKIGNRWVEGGRNVAGERNVQGGWRVEGGWKVGGR